MEASFLSQVFSLHIEMVKAELFSQIASSNVKDSSEIASLAQFGDVFEDDSEIFRQFPEIKGGSSEVLITPWSLNDPMKAAFRFLFSFKIKKIGAQIHKMHIKLELQFAALLCISCIAAGAGGSYADWSSFEMTQIAVQIVMAAGVWKFVWEMQFFKVVAGSSLEILEHLRFIMSKAGGNQVTQLMNIFEKLSYIEARMMHMTSDASDSARQIAQEFESYDDAGLEGHLKMQCRIWLAARMKFKDVKVNEMAAAWSKVWKAGCAQALKYAASEEMKKVIELMQIKMPAVFDDIIGL